MTRTPFSPKTLLLAVWGDSEDGRDLIAKIKDTPVACVQTENQFIFIYEME